MPYRRRIWFLLLAVATTMAAGCIRFRDDRPIGADDASTVDPDATSDAPPIIPEAGDAPPPPVCDRFAPTIAPTLVNSIAGDLITAVLGDCALRRYFANLPPVRVIHLQECLAAQIGSVMGCLKSDGERFKYPVVDSKGELCRSMALSHAALSTSDGDFDAFVKDLGTALRMNDLSEDEIMRVAAVFGATRNDIVRLKEAGPTLPCDGPDAQ